MATQFTRSVEAGELRLGPPASLTVKVVDLLPGESDFQRQLRMCEDVLHWSVVVVCCRILLQNSAQGILLPSTFGLVMIGTLGMYVTGTRMVLEKTFNFQAWDPSSTQKSQTDDFVRTYCPVKNYLARYVRISVHPALLLYVDTKKDPCVIVKLSCPLIGNADSLTLFDEGLGKSRYPIVDGIIGEIVLNKLLAMSRKANATLPVASGVVITDLEKHLFEGHKDHVPTTCFWNKSTVTGIAFKYLQGLSGLKLTNRTFAKMNQKDWDSLATTVIADTLSGNEDRSSTHNLFQFQGKIYTIDLPMSMERLLLQDSHESWQRTKRMLISPTIYKNVDQSEVSKPMKKQLYDSMLAIIHELCQGFTHTHCLGTMANVAAALNQDPHIQLRMAAAHRKDFVNVMCRTGKHRRAGRPARSFALCQTAVGQFFQSTRMDTMVILPHMIIANITTSINRELVIMYTQLKQLTSVKHFK